MRQRLILGGDIRKRVSLRRQHRLRQQHLVVLQLHRFRPHAHETTKCVARTLELLAVEGFDVLQELLNVSAFAALSVRPSEPESGRNLVALFDGHDGEERGRRQASLAGEERQADNPGVGSPSTVLTHAELFHVATLTPELHRGTVLRKDHRLNRALTSRALSPTLEDCAGEPVLQRGGDQANGLVGKADRLLAGTVNVGRALCVAAAASSPEC
mmetsp:Transcript_64704/g.187529  ORF Transcript_64704/g.187529 Transcript_64704/m.187529 type:complete len:214 (+) Transcript_64704:209-850(+)